MLVAAARPAAIAPQQITMDGGHRQALGGVQLPLGVVKDLLVAPGSGPLHPGREPVDAHRLAGRGHLLQAVVQVGQGRDEGPVGLAEPERYQFGEQQVQALADLGLGDPDHPTGPPVRQPVQHDSADGVQADLQAQWRVAAPPGRVRRCQVREPTGKPGQHLHGQRRMRAV